MNKDKDTKGGKPWHVHLQSNGTTMHGSQKLLTMEGHKHSTSAFEETANKNQSSLSLGSVAPFIGKS
jgi:hypothetical protein